MPHLTFLRKCLVCHHQSPSWLCPRCEAKLHRSGNACRYCMLPIISGTTCATCQTQPHAYTQMLCPFYYSPMLAHIMHRFKYQKQGYWAQYLSTCLVEKAAQLPQDSTLIPVPLHPKRSWQRSYNQATLLAQHLAQITSFTVNDTLLKRQIYTTSQSQRSRLQRQALPDNTFIQTEALPSGHIILLDDIITTGSTLKAICNILPTNNITLLACARTLPS